jgi:hypothetical protein
MNSTSPGSDAIRADKTGVAVTQWFEPKHPPARAGIYEFEDLPFPFSLFDGMDWRGAGGCPNDVDGTDETLTQAHCTYHREARWRGLAEKP